MLFAIVAVLMSATTPEQARDGLLGYTIPAYPCCEEGKVELVVEIDSDGKVVSTLSSVSADHAGLNLVAAAAVRSWKFAPAWPRIARVTISFDGERQTDCETATTATYESPLTLHVQRTR
jgi:TonB family protein